MPITSSVQYLDSDLWDRQHKPSYRQISQMTYQPKSVSKMANFETLISVSP